MKYLYRYLFFGFLVVLVGANRALAEFSCRAEVSYKWARTAQTETGSSGANGAGTAKDDKGAQNAAVASQGEPLVVRLMGVERTGKDEEAAKLALEAELNRQKVRASEICLRDHEGFGACIATKLSVNSSVLNSLGFSARGELEKALTAECQGQQGRCLGVEVSTPQCKELVSAEPTPAADAKKAEGKKK